MRSPVRAVRRVRMVRRATTARAVTTARGARRVTTVRAARTVRVAAVVRVAAAVRVARTVRAAVPRATKPIDPIAGRLTGFLSSPMIPANGLVRMLVVRPVSSQPLVGSDSSGWSQLAG